MTVQKLDPVKYELFYHRMLQALLEAKETVKRLSTSVIVREADEVAQGFYRPNGDCSHLAAAMLVHIQTISRSIKHMISSGFGEDVGFYDGDQFLNNDCHIGGMHIPDMMLIAPVY